MMSPMGLSNVDVRRAWDAHSFDAYVYSPQSSTHMASLRHNCSTRKNVLRNKWRNATSLPKKSTSDEKGDRQQVEGIRYVFGIGRVVHSWTQRNYSKYSTTALVGESCDQYELEVPHVTERMSPIQRGEQGE